MYIKIIGCVFVILCTGMIGCQKAEELEIRVKRLKEMKRMIVFLQGELRFHRAELSEAFENVAERLKAPFSCFLKQISKELTKREKDCFEKVWEKHSKSLLKKDGFSKEDARLLELLEGSLGYLDISMQMDNLNLTISQVEDAIDMAKERQQTRGKLYKTMGFSVGVLITLLIV